METIFFRHSDKLIEVLLLIVISIALRLILQILGQRWITTTAHTATLVLLPILTYVITNVITGNIALSLGMVGALSIVRFRHPVRSPLELSVYFGSITMGIAASVSILWLIFLAGSIGFAAIVLVFCHYLSVHIFRKPFFTSSFTEGNALSTLDIIASKTLPVLEQSKQLTLKRVSKENVQYILTSNKFDDLLNTQKSFKDNDSIISYQLSK
jgi:hypothetical protein